MLQHAAMQACIDFDPRMCTSLLMDHLRDGGFQAWSKDSLAVTSLFPAKKFSA